MTADDNPVDEAMETFSSCSQPISFGRGAFVAYNAHRIPVVQHEKAPEFSWETLSDSMSDHGNDLSDSMSESSCDASSDSSEPQPRNVHYKSGKGIASAPNVLDATFLKFKNNSSYAAGIVHVDHVTSGDSTNDMFTSLDRLPVEMLYEILSHLNRSSLEQLFQAYLHDPRMCRLISKYISARSPSEVCFLEIIGEQTVAKFLKPDYILNIGQSMQVYEISLFPKSQLFFHLGSPVEFGLPGDETYCCALYSGDVCSKTSIFCSDTHKTLLYVLSIMINQRKLPSFILRNIKLCEELVAVFEEWHLENRVSVDMMKICNIDLSGYSKSLSHLVECFSPIWFFFRDPKILDPSLLNKVFDRAFFKGHALRRCKDVHITDLKYTPHLALWLPIKKYILNGSWKTLHITYQIHVKQTTVLSLLKECISARKDFVKFSIVTKRIYSFIQYAIHRKIVTQKWKGEELRREPNSTVFKLYDRNAEDFYVKIHYCYFVISRKPVPLSD